jgi:hypothetical protein
VLVDPHRCRDVHDSVELGYTVLAVDQTRVRGRRAADPLACRLLARCVQCDCDDDELIRAELVLKRLPDRQVVAAASP